MTVMPWPEWLPDQPDFGSTGSPNIRNCIPLTQSSYGPMPTPALFSDNALAERCQGSYSLKARDNSIHLFAGDREHLYHLPPGAGRTLNDISRAAGGAYATPGVSSGGFWSMTSYGSRVLATNYIDPIQSLTLPFVAGTKFDTLSADAPKAKYITTVKDFVMVGNTNDPVGGQVPFRAWWSGINQPATWPTPGTAPAIAAQSDFQDFQQTDLGVITGLQSGFSQGSDVVVFMERGIWTGAYVGPPLLFSFRVAQGASGTTSPLSIVQDHARTNAGQSIPVIYYLSEDGFAAFDGSTSIPIGAQKFDRQFFKEVDDTYINYVQGVSDPRSRSVLWAFPSVGSNGLFNRMLVYNWELGRATIIDIDDVATHLEWLTTAMYSTSYTLDQIDGFFPAPTGLETPNPSFDDPFWTGNAAGRLTMFCPDHKLYIGGGPPFGPTLESAETQPFPDARGWVRMTRPLTDGAAPSATIEVGHRERLTDPVTWEPPVSINALGECPQRATGRYVRFRLKMPAGQNWRHLQGVDVQTIPESKRR